MRVRWQRRALADLRAIRIYLQPRSARATERILARIREVTGNLALFPLAGPALEDEPLRRLVITGTPYVVYYQVRDDFVSIEAVFHRAQDRPI